MTLVNLDKKYCIYFIYDDKQRPFYVGQTCNFKARKNGHLRAIKNLNDNSYKTNKTRKLFKENKKIEIIKIRDNLTKQEANEQEKFYIHLMQGWGKKFGFENCNLTLGGDGCQGYKHTEKTKQLLSKKRIGKNPWNKGLTKETDDRVRKYGEGVSKSLKGKFCGIKNPNYKNRGKNSPLFGKKFSEEHKEKISKSHIGIKHTEETKIKISQTKRLKKL